MLPAHAASPAGPHASLWGGRLAALRAGERLTLVGLDPADLAAARVPCEMPLLRLDLAGTGRADVAIARILDDLADLALAAWPAWPPSALAPWRRAADRFAAVGRRPRFPDRVSAAVQFAGLYPAAGAPILVFPLDPARSDRAAGLIAALEWTCRQGGAVVALLPEMPPFEAPWDRLLYGALAVATATRVPATQRVVVPPSIGPRGSAVERRMRGALAAAHDLADLFEDEVVLHLRPPLGPTPRVDMLWREGKVIVELDGAEHARDPNYGADRHRDYELLAAGYLVLRLTNAEVELDLERSLDKIRRVVNLRRGPA